MIDGAITLATLTQLIALFIQERRQSGNATKQEFMEWLSEHRHEQLKAIISETHHLSAQVDELLREDHVQILEEIQTVGKAVAQVLSRLDVFAPLAKSIAPDFELSDEAIEIIQHFYDAGVEFMCTSPDGSGVQFENKYALKFDEPRFIRDDLNALERLGYIKQHSRINEFDYTTYNITRRGAKYAALSKRQGQQ